MAELTVQAASRAGVTPSSQTLGASNTFANDGTVILRITNGHSSDCTVTATITRTIDGVTPSGKAITVPASNAVRYFGPFPVTDYGSTATITLSHQTSMTAEVISVN